MFEEMPESERVEAFASLCKKYEHRILLPLSEDTFGLEAHLKDKNVDFARVPFQSIDASYYLLKDSAAMKQLLDFLPSDLDLGEFCEPWSHLRTRRLQ